MRMAADDDFRERHAINNNTPKTRYAINSHYLAYPGPRGVHVRRLFASHDATFVPYDAGRPQFEPILALSHTRLNLLAAANGSQVLVFNIAKNKTRCILKGNGRVVTSIAFSDREHEYIVTGAVDGSICLWWIKEPTRPKFRWSGLHGACVHVCLGSIHSGLVATYHGEHLSIWSTLDAKPLTVAAVGSQNLAFVGWRDQEDVVAVTQDGAVLTFLTNYFTRTLKAGSRNGDNDRRNGFHETSDHFDPAKISSSQLGQTVRQASMLGSDGVVVLPQHGSTLYFYSFSVLENTSTELWRLSSDYDPVGFAIRYGDGVEAVVSDVRHAEQTYSIPPSVLDAMEWAASKTRAQNAASDQHYKSTPLGKMFPSKTRRHIPHKSFVRRLSPPRRQPIEETPRKKPAIESAPDTRRSETPTPRTMTSSLEIPKTGGDEDDRDSPMPFLSPAIPARKVSPRPMTPLDDTMNLFPRASFNSMTSTATHGHDSDSDDETFAGNLRNSTSFLPGGVNVPLPRTCGAAFAPNGQLLTFFPSSQPRPDSASQDKEPTSKDIQSSEVTRLFPNFGNCVEFPAIAHSEQSSSDSFDEVFRHRSSIPWQPSSLDGRSPWSAKVSPVKTTLSSLPGQNKVRISVRDVAALTPTRPILATKYRFDPNETQSASTMCLENASSSTAEGLHDAAEAWRLLAIILMQRSTDLASDVADALADSLATTASILTGMLQSPQHPLAVTWAVDKVFAWLEQQADIQSLAYMSALLLNASRSLLSESSVTAHKPGPFRHRPTAISKDGLNSIIEDPTLLPHGVPLLRTNSSALATSVDSPVKRNISLSSSRNASLPTTPYLDSSAGTPPLTLTAMSRNGMKITHSGSASPEHQRNSFGAAAKNYAASIAEKFASYGSSPPAKRFGHSPSNELSSSLPTTNVTGSWSKSVSFASTVGPGGVSNRSLSLAQEDDHYESDRTVDDSLPHTPKNTTTGVLFTMKNEASFGAIIPSHGTSSLLPVSLLERGTLWRSSYAEQLRSRDLELEAAALENVSVPTSRASLSPKPKQHAVICQGSGVTSRALCNICFCVLHAAKQLCPVCLHTTHPECLDAFISTLGVAGFTCPSGCDCNCTAVTDLRFDAARRQSSSGHDDTSPTSQETQPD